MLHSVTELARRLAQFEWCIEHDRKERFITSDTRLCLGAQQRFATSSRGSASRRLKRSASRSTLPSSSCLPAADPEPRSARVSPTRSAAANQDVALARHNFVVAHPTQSARVEALELPAASPNPPVRQRAAPAQAVGRAHPEDGEMLHVWVPCR